MFVKQNQRSRPRYLLLSTLFGLLALRPAYANLPENYKLMGAQEKQKTIWNEIERSEYARLPFRRLNLMGVVPSLLAGYPWTSLVHSFNQMPLGQKRILHPIGSVAQVKFEINSRESPYTGILKSGGPGLVRISTSLFGLSHNHCLALKIFVDKSPSINFHAMPSLREQGKNSDFFENPFSVFLPKINESIDIVCGAEVQSRPSGNLPTPELESTFPLFEAAQTCLDGSREADPIYPETLIFIPNSALASTTQSPSDLRLRLATIPSGTLLFQLVVKDSPTSRARIIGSVVTESRFIASKYGDENLFFQQVTFRNKAPVDTVQGEELEEVEWQRTETHDPSDDLLGGKTSFPCSEGCWDSSETSCGSSEGNWDSSEASCEDSQISCDGSETSSDGPEVNTDVSEGRDLNEVDLNEVDLNEVDLDEIDLNEAEDQSDRPVDHLSASIPDSNSKSDSHAVTFIDQYFGGAAPYVAPYNEELIRYSVDQTEAPDMEWELISSE